MQEVKIDLLPGYGYSNNALYKKAETPKELKQIIEDAKQNIAAYRISVDGTPILQAKKTVGGKKWGKL